MLFAYVPRFSFAYPAVSAAILGGVAAVLASRTRHAGAGP